MSTFSWQLPGAPAGASGLSSQERLQQFDKAYGRDIWFDVREGSGVNYEITPAGDWKVASGRTALVQALIRRIITDPGEWQFLPEYGAGARMFVKSRNTPAVRDELTERVRAQLLADPRVESVEDIAVEITAELVRVAFRVRARGQSAENEAVTAAVEVY